MFVYLYGGPAHGAVVSVGDNRDAVYWPNDPAINYAVYHRTTVVTPDGWECTYFSFEGRPTESEMVHMICETWRAAWKATEPITNPRQMNYDMPGSNLWFENGVRAWYREFAHQ